MKKYIIKCFLSIFVFTLFVSFFYLIKTEKVNADTTYKKVYGTSKKVKLTDNGKRYNYCFLQGDESINVSGKVGYSDDRPKIKTDGHNLTVNLTGDLILDGGWNTNDDVIVDAFIHVTNGEKENKVGNVTINCNNHNIYQTGKTPNRQKIKLVSCKNTTKNKQSCKLYIEKGKFSQIASRHSGGAIKSVAKELRVYNCSFDTCYISDPVGFESDTSDFGGGAICAYSYENAGKVIYIGDCSFNNCWCVNGVGEEKGGALYVPFGNVVSVWGSSFSNCITRAKRWKDGNGNIYGDATSKHDNNGGAIHTCADYTYIATNTFNDNKAADAGGAIHAVGGRLIIGAGGQRVTFRNNYAACFPKSSDYTGGGAINTYNCNLEIGRIRIPEAWWLNDAGNFQSSSYYKWWETSEIGYVYSNVNFDNNHSRTWGGAIYTNAGNTSGTNYMCANFSNNHSGGGGAIASMRNGNATTSLINCNFTNNKSNSSSNWYGSPIRTDYSGGAVLSNQKLNVYNKEKSDTEFYNNSATYNGGAIYLNANGSAITQTRFKNNSAGWGGAIYLCSKSGDNWTYYPGYLSVWGQSEILNNNATYNGGGIYVKDDIHANNIGAPTLETGALAIQNNTANNSGGGICNEGGRIELRSRWSNISNNTAKSYSGGGIYNNALGGRNEGLFFVSSANLSGNSAGWGGGIYNEGYLYFFNPLSSSDYLQNINIQNNTATYNGGGIYNKNKYIYLTNNPNGGINNSYLNIAGNTAQGSGDNGAGVYNYQGTFTQNSNNISLYCHDNNGGDEFANVEGNLTLTGASNNSSTNHVVLGTTNKDVKALYNSGKAYLSANNESIIRSAATNTIYNVGTLNFQTINNQLHIHAYGKVGLFNNGTINCYNAKEKLIIKGMGSSSESGVYNESSGTINTLKACISTQENPFYYGINNKNNIYEFQGNITYCKRNGILNAKKIEDIKNSYIEHNGGYSYLGAGIYSTSNSTTLLDDNNYIQTNSTTTDGGGIYADTNANVQITGNNNVIQKNSASNGGGIYAKTNANVQITGNNNIIQENNATNGGGIYAGEFSTVQIGADTDSSTIKNRLIKNTGKGNNIYIDSYAKVKDYSTYHKVKENSGLGSVYITGVNSDNTQTTGRGEYQIGYATLFDNLTDEYPAYVYLNAGTYIDVTKNLKDYVTKDGTSYQASIYVMTNDGTKNGGTTNRDSNTGRIIAYNSGGQGNVDNFSDGNKRFKHIMSGTGGIYYGGLYAKDVSYSNRLNNNGKNELFTSTQVPLGNSGRLTKNTNNIFVLNNPNLSTEYCNSGDKNRQVFLTDKYKVRYYPTTTEKFNQLDQSQLNSISGLNNIGQVVDERINAEITRKYALVYKYWNEDLKITNENLTSNFGKFDKQNSWQTENGDVYSQYDDSSNNDYYTENQSINLYGVWSNTVKLLISHYLMNQDGSYDINSDYTSTILFGTNSTDLFLVSEAYHQYYPEKTPPYSLIHTVNSEEHTNFETWHEIKTINISDNINSSYVKNRLVDNNLIKDNVSYYSSYQTINITDNQATSDYCAVKIFYARKEYTVTVKGDSGTDFVNTTNPYYYGINYNQNNGNTTIEHQNSLFYSYSYDTTPDPFVTLNSTQGCKIRLYKNINYNITIHETSANEICLYKIIPETNNWTKINAQIDIYNGEGESHNNKTCYISFTPEEDGDYIISTPNKSLPSFEGEFNCCGLNQLEGSFAYMPEELTANYYAIDNSEDRKLNKFGIDGGLSWGESNFNNTFVGIFKENNNYTYTKLPGQDTQSNYSKGYSATATLPKYGNLNYIVITDKNEYDLKIEKHLEKQEGSGIPDTFYSGKITTNGLIKISTLKSLINNTLYNDYVNNSKTDYCYFYKIPGTIGYNIFYRNQINNFNDSDYLLADDNIYNKIEINYYRKTFDINTEAGSGVTATTISTDNWEEQSRSQTTITERYYLSEDNPFNLPKETRKTIYLDAQLKKGYKTNGWTASLQSYAQKYQTVLKNQTTSFKILSNNNVTFAITAKSYRNVTINHYLMNTDGIYELQEDYTRRLTNTSKTQIIPDDYKEDELEYIKNDINYRYLDHAEYLNETYNDTSSAISFNKSDKNAEVNLFYNRKKIPLYIYSNEYINSVDLNSTTLRKDESESYTYKYSNGINDINNGRQLNEEPLYVYFEEPITINSSIVNSNDGEDISFDGYTYGRCNFNSEDLECTSKTYELEAGAVERLNISVYGHSLPWKWHINYHENYSDNEYNCNHEKHMIDDVVEMADGYTNDDKTVDISWSDNTITANGKMFSSDSAHKMIKWESSDGVFVEFGDTINRNNFNLDNSTRTIDLYAVWKDVNPKLNIYTEDLYFEVGSDITLDKILKKIHVSDETGKILSDSESNLGIVDIKLDRKYEDIQLFPKDSDEFSSSNLSDSEFDDYINTDHTRTYLITVRAIKDDVISYKTYKVIVYENLIGKTYIRAIDKSMLGSLSINSVWRQPQNYARLIKTLNKGHSNNFNKDNDEAKYIFAFNSSDMQELQTKIKNNGYKYIDVIKDSNIKKEPSSNYQKPDAPQGLTCIEGENGSVNVSWLGYDNMTYRVYVNGNYIDTTTTPLILLDSEFFENNEEYIISVVAVNEDYVESDSTEITFKRVVEQETETTEQ